MNMNEIMTDKATAMSAEIAAEKAAKLLADRQIAVTQWGPAHLLTLVQDAGAFASFRGRVRAADFTSGVESESLRVAMLQYLEKKGIEIPVERPNLTVQGLRASVTGIVAEKRTMAGRLGRQAKMGQLLLDLSTLAATMGLAHVVELGESSEADLSLGLASLDAGAAKRLARVMGL